MISNTFSKAFLGAYGHKNPCICCWPCCDHDRKKNINAEEFPLPSSTEIGDHRLQDWRCMFEGCEVLGVLHR